MLFLSGSRVAGRPLLNTPATSYRLDGVPVWAADNGAFNGRYPGDAAFLAWLDRLAPHQDRCAFVAVPDVVGDATATLQLWPEMAARIRARGWPAALVLQDGMTPADVARAAPDALFIGGSDRFKLGPEVRQIINSGAWQWVHMGRVNSRRRMRYAAAIGCHSVDGTVLAFDPSRPMFDWAAELADPLPF